MRQAALFTFVSVIILVLLIIAGGRLGHMTRFEFFVVVFWAMVLAFALIKVIAFAREFIQRR
jgi:hypothetical protein